MEQKQSGIEMRMAKILKTLDTNTLSESEAIGALKEARELGDPIFLAKVAKEVRAILPNIEI